MARVNRVATALERRGIVATYEVHDRLLSNRASRRRFVRSRPQLDDVQQAIVASLDREGYAVTTFGEFFTDSALWTDVEEEAARFVAETEEALAREASGDEGELRRRAGKEFVVRRYSYGVEVGFEDPWFRLAASRRLLDVANAYLRLWSKLEYVDYWYTVPQAKDAERVASQRWHRDYNDKHLLKVFLYLSDVDEGSGPFEYLRGSAAGGAFAHLWRWRPLGENYPVEEKLAQSIPLGTARTFTGPEGTMIFCNTSGFHRGGFATSKTRVLATVTYCSPASLASLTERNFTFKGEREAVDVDPVVRFALN